MAKFNYLSQINTLQVIPLGSFEPLPPSKGDFFVSFLYLELTLNIDLELNALDVDLARSVGEYFSLNNEEMDATIEEVHEAVSKWENLATKMGIPSAQRRLMEAAFNLK